MRTSNPLHNQVRVIRFALRRVDRALLQLGTLAQKLERTSQRAADAAPRKLELSPARRRALALQGQYMGYMRQLGPRQKDRVRAVKAAKGYLAAIAMARRLAKG